MVETRVLRGTHVFPLSIRPRDFITFNRKLSEIVTECYTSRMFYDAENTNPFVVVFTDCQKVCPAVFILPDRIQNNRINRRRSLDDLEQSPGDKRHSSTVYVNVAGDTGSIIHHGFTPMHPCGHFVGGERSKSLHYSH